MDNALWIAVGVCLVLVIGAATPLLRDRGREKHPPPPPKEALRDWRNGE